MFEAKLSRILLVLGAAVGVAGIVALAIDLRINLPDWMVRVAMIKLALIGSLGLLGAGALLGRHAKRQVLPSGADRRLLDAETVEVTPARRAEEPARANKH